MEQTEGGRSPVRFCFRPILGPCPTICALQAEREKSLYLVRSGRPRRRGELYPKLIEDKCVYVCRLPDSLVQRRPEAMTGIRSGSQKDWMS